MEATGEVEKLPEKIRLPRLEDADLEDCALPPDSIKEAFLKAASAIGSRAASIFSASDDEEARCVSDPWPNVGEESDTLMGIKDGVDPPPGPCASEKGGGVPEVKADKVVVAGPEVAEGKDCVDGLRGLKIREGGEKKSKNEEEEEDEEERESERPILAEAYL